MVAQTIALPNMRKMFIPDDGYAIVDCDLSGADAQVVAWEANDEDLKSAFRAGLKVHIKNAREVFPEITASLTDDEIKKQSGPGGIYHDCKRAVHGTNYGGSAPAIASILKWPANRAEEFQERWFFLHPGIKEWHNRTMRCLMGSQCWWCNTMADSPGHCLECGQNLGRTVGNRFGFRRVYFDRVEGLLPEALAWVPQSTVALVCDQGALRLRSMFPEVQLLMQVHDSIVFQVPLQHVKAKKEQYINALSVGVPYPDPLCIPWGWAHSTVSWGDCG